MRKAITIAAAVAILALPALADDDVRHPFSASILRAGIRRVVIDIPAGEVSLGNSDGATIAIAGEARRTYDGELQREKQQPMVDDITAVIRTDGDTAVVERQYGPNAGSWIARNFHTQFRIRIDVPRATDVVIGTRYGELSMDGDFGDVEAELRAGEIHLRTPRASVRDLTASVGIGEVHADFGDERVSHEGLFPRATHYYNSGGRSRINVRSTTGEVHVTLTR